jgi:hypothetical protein
VISLIRTEDLVKDYALETQVVHALQGVSVTIQAGQNGDGHGTVRVRQAHFPDHPWLPRYAQRPRSAATSSKAGTSVSASPTEPLPKCLKAR